MVAVPLKVELQVTSPVEELIVPAEAGDIDHWKPLYPEVPEHAGALVPVVNVEVPGPWQRELIP